MTDLILHAPFAGWLSAIDAVPDPVFGERMMGDGFAIDPTEPVLRAPADATVIAVPDSRHAVTLRLDNGAELLIHIGLETVALAGAGFTARVMAGARVRRGDPLIEVDLDAVARGAKDLVTPIVVASEGFRLTVDQPGRLVAAGDPVATLFGNAKAITPAAAEEGAVAERKVRVTTAHGIHARPAARIGALLKPYVATVEIVRDGRAANARSTLALLGLGVRRDDEVALRARGADAEAAIAALEALIEAGIGEDPANAPALPAPRPVGDGNAISAAPGLAIGQVLQLRLADLPVPEQGAGIAVESDALACALHAVADALPSTGTAGDIAEAHRALLADPELAVLARTAIAAGRSAAFAWRAATNDAVAAIEATGDALLAERVADLRDLERQVIAVLLGIETPPAPAIAPGTILVAHDLLPSQFLALDRAKLAGICTAAGGPTAHVAILAAAARVPMLVAAGETVLAIPDGRTVVIDADRGRLHDDPGVALLDATARAIAEAQALRAAAVRSAHDDCVMADGTRIEIFANLGSAEDAAAAVAAGAEGCGLLRTEFLFLDRATAPDEEEQRAAYARIAATLGHRPLILRTLDIGGDKPVAYLPAPHEDNPALGLRGVRLGLARPDMLATQLRAILRAVPGDQCRIMLPMIVDIGEFRQVRAMVDAALAATGRSDRPMLGVMIETPAAAMLADQIAAEADFLSIGTNDLTQYALACDRGNAAVSAKVDALHPAVLRLIAAAARGGAAHGRWTGMCGGLASDPLAAPLLIGLGITELSAIPPAIPMLKAAVRPLTMDACRALADRALAATNPAEVRAILGQAKEQAQ